MITAVDAEQAIMNLLGSDHEFARLKTYLKALENKRKSVRSVQFLAAKGTVIERQAMALVSPQYIEHLDKIAVAQSEFETLKNQRETATLQIEFWRSINRNQQQGNI